MSWSGSKATWSHSSANRAARSNQGSPVVLVPLVGALAEVLVVVPTLEVLVELDGVVHVLADVGPDHLGRDGRVVEHADDLADVVAQRPEHHLVVGTGPLGQGRRLQAVRELVGGEPVGDVAQLPQHGEELLRHPRLVLHRLPPDHRPLLRRRLIHPRERRSGLRLGRRHASRAYDSNRSVPEEENTLERQLEPPARIDGIELVLGFLVAVHDHWLPALEMVVLPHHPEDEESSADDQRRPNEVAIDGVPRAPRPASISTTMPSSSCAASTS